MSEPIWRKNLRDAILLAPLVLIHGNVKDVFRLDGVMRHGLPGWMTQQQYLSFDGWLALELEQLGFPIVVIYDPVDGAAALRGEMIPQFTQMAQEGIHKEGGPPGVGRDLADPDSASSPSDPPQLPKSELPAADGPDAWMASLSVKQEPNDFFRTLYCNVFPRPDVAVAIICRLTDRYLSYTDRQDQSERELSLLIQKAAMAIPPPSALRQLQGRIILLFDLEGAIPQELNVQAPFARSVRIPAPSLDEREQFFTDNHHQFFSEPHDRFEPEQNTGSLRDVANLSDGLKIRDLLSLVSLSHREQLGLGTSQIKTLLDRFKYGTRKNAWLQVADRTLRDAKERLRQRVKGQDKVIDEVVPTLVRAKLGMSDVWTPRHSSKPRGSFFFVGPTGVGKTELSKSIAELIFGDESAILRFDMSEYSEEHQQARLIGAPPGYVGFDQGGQLTNAISEKPFSVVLFDEIEKAHGSLLDKFLQILDDGRLTDGMGRTVYFSEAILIFTSNIGTAPHAGRRSQREGTGHALSEPTPTPSTIEEYYVQLAQQGYDQLCEHFRREVKDYFVNRLGRPEILNRIGEGNILVFNFLKDETAKTEIIQKQVDQLGAYLREKHRVRLKLTPAFQVLLKVHPGGFERNGARGVKHLLEKLVLNKLAEDILRDRMTCENKVFKVDYCLKEAEIKTGRFDVTRLTHVWADA